MPFDATGKWIPENDSVSEKLTGLLATDSKYLTQARGAGERTANRRGLMNSSIAAGSSEAAAIAAAAPIASQDAAQIAQKNNAVLEGNIQYDNSSRLQTQQDKSAMERQLSGQESQKELTRLDSELQLLRQKENQGFQLTQQERDNIAALERQREQISSSERQALLGAEVSMRNTDITAANDLKSMYLQSVSNLSGNNKMKAADRNAYIAEFQRITQQSKPLQTTIASVPLAWSNPATGSSGATSATTQPVASTTQPAPV